MNTQFTILFTPLVHFAILSDHINLAHCIDNFYRFKGVGLFDLLKCAYDERTGKKSV